VSCFGSGIVCRDLIKDAIQPSLQKSGADCLANHGIEAKKDGAVVACEPS
jgi:hypothetical protein